MILFSTRVSSSRRSRSRSAWVYAEIMPLQVLGVPLVPPRCGDLGPAAPRRDDIHEQVVVCSPRGLLLHLPRRAAAGGKENFHFSDRTFYYTQTDKRL